MADTQPKSGWWTSEFALTLLGGVLGPSGLLMMLVQSGKLDGYGLWGAIASAEIVAAVTIWRYISARQALKSAQGSALEPQK